MPEPPATSRMIVGVDTTPAGVSALAWAVAEARRHGCELVAVHAITSRTPAADPIAREHTARAVVTRSLSLACGGQPAAVKITVVTPEGSPGAELVRLADRPGDVIVVGTERRLPFRRLAAGSISRHCLEHAECPVVVIPAPPSPVPHAASPRTTPGEADGGSGSRRTPRLAFGTA